MRGDATNPAELALVWAAKYGHTPVVEYLLNRGVPITAMDDMIPLHWAAADAHTRVIELLLARDAPLEALNAYGGTALDSTLWFINNAPVAGVAHA